jgi:4-amino-4-deoxy-L-arabinose transferase-like glycosyltransferase
VTARPRILPYILLAFLSLAFFAPGIASLPPSDRDESRYMQATTQMFETGNFLDIRFQDQPRYLQPAGIYWLQAASVALLSTPEARTAWAHRVPSLLGATAAVLLTAWIGNLLFGAPVGFVAAVLMAAALILGVEARLAKIDAVLLATVLAAQACLARIYLGKIPIGLPFAAGARYSVMPGPDPGTPRPLPDRGTQLPGSSPAMTRTGNPAESDAGAGWVAGFWLALGAGLMLKGPIILLVSLGTVLLLAASERRVGWLRRLRPSWGVPLMLAVVLPWLIAIAVISDGAFFAAAIGHSLLGKVATGQQSHGAPPGYFLAAFPVTFWPGSLFAVFAIPFAWAYRREPAVRFCLCWIAPTWFVFELVVTKLPHYVMPTYPAIACLTAAAALGPASRSPKRWVRCLMRGYAALWLVLGVAVAAAMPAATWVLERRLDPVGITTAMIAAALLTATLVLLRREQPVRSVACAAAAALVLFVSVYAWQVPHLRTIWLSPRIAEAVARVRPCPDTILATAPYQEPSLVFLLGTATLRTDARGAAEHLLRHPGCGLALVGTREREAFLAILNEAHATPRPLDEVRGLNYSNGQKLDLTLYGLPRPG